MNAEPINYSYFFPILTLRRDNSGIVLRKVGILTLRNKGRIPTLRRTVLELHRLYIYIVYTLEIHTGQNRDADFV